jgi:hypothetical protein
MAKDQTAQRTFAIVPCSPLDYEPFLQGHVYSLVIQLRSGSGNDVLTSAEASTEWERILTALRKLGDINFVGWCGQTNNSATLTKWLDGQASFKGQAPFFICILLALNDKTDGNTVMAVEGVDDTIAVADMLSDGVVRQMSI